MHGTNASGFKIQQAKTTRLFQADTSVSQTFVHDGAYVTDAVLRDSTSSYTPGISSRTGGSSTFSHSNIKNAEIQTDLNANWSGMQQYDAFGNIRSSSGWNGPFGYAGGFGYQEDATGLKLLGHRYYDPSTGRFLTRDPIKDGRNYYIYCDNNPMQAVDPDGLQWVKYHPGGWYWKCPFGSPPPASPMPKPDESVEDFQRRWIIEGRGGLPPIHRGPIPTNDPGFSLGFIISLGGKEPTFGWGRPGSGKVGGGKKTDSPKVIIHGPKVKLDGVPIGGGTISGSYDLEKGKGSVIIQFPIKD